MSRDDLIFKSNFRTYYEVPKLDVIIIVLLNHLHEFCRISSHTSLNISSLCDIFAADSRNSCLEPLLLMCHYWNQLPSQFNFQNYWRPLALNICSALLPCLSRSSISAQCGSSQLKDIQTYIFILFLSLVNLVAD